MLQITDQATRHLLRARSEHGFDDAAGARFARTSTGVALTFVLGPYPGDEVITQAALPIFVADDVAALLDHAVIDIADDPAGSSLVVRLQSADRSASRS